MKVSAYFEDHSERFPEDRKEKRRRTIALYHLSLDTSCSEAISLDLVAQVIPSPPFDLI